MRRSGARLATVGPASNTSDGAGEVEDVLVQTTIDDNRVTATVSGEVDADNCGELETTVREALGSDRSTLLVEASQLSFLDSSGISTMLQLRNLVVEERNGSFRLCDPTPVVRRTLEITGLLDVLGAE